MTDTTPKTAEALAQALRAVLSLIRRNAPDLSGKVLGDAEAALAAFAAQPQAEPVAADYLSGLIDRLLMPPPAMTGAQLAALHQEAAHMLHLLAARPPVAQQGAAEAVAWGVFAFVDGAWVLQWPVRPRRETAISDSGLYMPGTRLEVRPLYTTPFAAAQPVAQGLTDEPTPYQKDGESAQECIERHRKEHDALLSLLAQDRAKIEAADKELRTGRRFLFKLNGQNTPLAIVFNDILKALGTYERDSEANARRESAALTTHPAQAAAGDSNG
jgi:hypothetical protein